MVKDHHEYALGWMVAACDTGLHVGRGCSPENLAQRLRDRSVTMLIVAEEVEAAFIGERSESQSLV